MSVIMRVLDVLVRSISPVLMAYQNPGVIKRPDCWLGMHRIERIAMGRSARLIGSPTLVYARGTLPLIGLAGIVGTGIWGRGTVVE